MYFVRIGEAWQKPLNFSWKVGGYLAAPDEETASSFCQTATALSFSSV